MDAKQGILFDEMTPAPKRGIHFAFNKSQTVWTNKLDAQVKKQIFGGGYLISDRIAAERADAVVWELSARELKIVKSLDK